uniref:Uncharacterized protein n=1 Tax=viral metagenome TaxID=1070528 RepID=A0A6C0HYU5_9ZZZZ
MEKSVDKVTEINIKIENVGGDENKHYQFVIDNTKFQKMLFVYNAINDGWSVKKRNDSYIFSKNHEGKKEVFSDSYLLTFMKTNLDMNKLLS